MATEPEKQLLLGYNPSTKQVIVDKRSVKIYSPLERAALHVLMSRAPFASWDELTLGLEDSGGAEAARKVNWGHIGRRILPGRDLFTCSDEGVSINAHVELSEVSSIPSTFSGPDVLTNKERW